MNTILGMMLLAICVYGLTHVLLDVHKRLNDVEEKIRVAEQRDAPAREEQKCPTCDGRGMRKYGDERGLWHCYDCNGTGISNHSVNDNLSKK